MATKGNTAKTTDPDMIRVTFWLPSDLQKNFKVYAAKEGVAMSVLLTEWIEEKIKKKGGR